MGHVSLQYNNNGKQMSNNNQHRIYKNKERGKRNCTNTEVIEKNNNNNKKIPSMPFEKTAWCW